MKKDEWKGWRHLQAQLEFPILVWSNSSMMKYECPKIAMCTYKKLYALDDLIGSRFIDCKGVTLLISDSKLGKIKLNSFGDVFDLITPWLARKTILLKWSQSPSVEMMDLKEAAVSHVMKKKWYASPDPAWTRAEKLKSVELAKQANGFGELFEHLSYKMSHKYMKAMFDT